ncbi:hypothetical protein [Teredinibacter sp. KSP-S5-2]|uniref:hypothetical protein n=1 Tax=Teredinibacter sp. KSP-S5-2 TaxID=3034506 RepID=UPI0029344BB7|nr:hypothetical protein [Teredinibacter sp. KSP-S5-2]WNO11234.1 hypothetical protein P5V12_08615 [Teredinibacter sp. KSP-S5-2]
MSYLWCRFLVLSLVILLAPSGWANPVQVAIPTSDTKDLTTFIADRSLLDIDNFHQTRRDIALQVLQRQALLLGGYTKPLESREVINNRRILTLVVQGKVAISGISFWLSGLENYREQVWVTDEIIGDGSFVVGMYTTESRLKSFQVNEDLHALVPISNRSWEKDWQALLQFHRREPIDTFNWESVVRMLVAGRADYTLAPFQQTEGMVLNAYGQTLHPIPRVKFLIPGSQHWVVSKIHPEGAAIYRALQLGLAQLKAQGRLRTALTEAGFYNESVIDWQTVNERFIK